MAEPQTTGAATTSNFQEQLSSSGASHIRGQFPGDNILPDADTVSDQRKTIHAPAEDVWPWLVQWGKGRGGWYVPSKFEKALPEKFRSAPAIDSRWQTLKVGDRVPDYGLGTKKNSAAPAEYHLEVAVIENNRALVYKGQRLGQDFTWALLLESPSGAAAGRTGGSSADSTASAAECVLHLRFRGKSTQTGWKAKVTQEIGKVADKVMASAMFPGIADRVELQQKKVGDRPVTPAAQTV